MKRKPLNDPCIHCSPKKLAKCRASLESILDTKCEKKLKYFKWIRERIEKGDWEDENL